MSTRRPATLTAVPPAAGPIAAPAATAPAWGVTWQTALEALELDVTDTEAMLTRLHAEAEWMPEPAAPWQLPAGRGPLPSTLADRARALVERQQRAAADLTRAMVGNRRQQRAAAAIDQRTAARPVYIDTAV